MTKETRVIVSKNNFKKVISALNPRQMRGLKESVGMRLERAFVQRIAEGDSDWAPLSSAWAAKKGHEKQWYYTGRLEKAIEYDIEGNDVHVGILKHETYPETGSTVAVVAASLEYGAPSRHIPARPLFRPVFKEQADKIVKAAAKDIKARIERGAL